MKMMNTKMTQDVMIALFYAKHVKKIANVLKMHMKMIVRYVNALVIMNLMRTTQLVMLYPVAQNTNILYNMTDSVTMYVKSVTRSAKNAQEVVISALNALNHKYLNSLMDFTHVNVVLDLSLTNKTVLVSKAVLMY